MSPALALFALCAAPVDAAALVQRFQVTWERTTAVSYRLRKVERLREGELVEEVVRVKLRRSPMAVYIAAELPRPGQEIVYDAARDARRFWVHPGRFPDLTLRLDLRGGLATNRQHHLVSQSGFGYLAELLAGWLRAPEARAEPATAVSWRGKPAQLVRWTARAAPRRAAAHADEPVFEFAERAGVDAYYFVYLNPAVSGVTAELSAGEYLVPATYGARAEAIFAEESGLPVEVSVWDDQGRLYERLEFLDLAVDPSSSELDFSPDNPVYGF